MADSKKVQDKSQVNAATERLLQARIGLLMRAPFFGNMATRMNLIESSEDIPTCATDGRNFYYNVDFVMKQTAKQMEFVFCHEVLHACYDHMGRIGNRDRALANIAADYVVNYDIVEQNIGEKPEKILYDKKYAGMTFEQVYDLLLQNADKVNIPQLADMVLDEHMDGDALSEEEKAAIRDEVREAMISAVEAAGRDADKIPGGIQRMVKELTEPKIDWRELLEQQIQSTIRSDFSWMKPSRRSWHSDAVMPGMLPGTTIDVAIAIDTSGSIGADDLKDFLSEIQGIMDQYDEYKITVWSFDTAVHNPQVFDSTNMESISEYQPGGGGGTLFTVNWDWMKENELQPKKLIFFTDGMPYGSWGEEEYCDVVWIIKGNPEVTPPFGTWAIYEKL